MIVNKSSFIESLFSLEDIDEPMNDAYVIKMPKSEELDLSIDDIQDREYPAMIKKPVEIPRNAPPVSSKSMDPEKAK